MGNIVSLTDVRTHLLFPNPTQPSQFDGTLQKFINAADAVIKFECGDILPGTHSEYYDGGDYTIYLRHTPIVTVQNVEEGWGFLNWELDYVQVNSPPPYSLFAYSIDSFENGEISRRSAGNVNIPFRPGDSNIFIQYVAGMESIPGNVTLAELELIAHWFQNSQLRSAVQGGANVSYDATGGANYTRDTESGIQNINIGVPVRILELLKPNRHRPIIA